MTTGACLHGQTDTPVPPGWARRLLERTDQALTSADAWLAMMLVHVGRCVLDSFADYGAAYAGRPSLKAEPTRWQEEDLDLLLNMPPGSDGR